MSKAKDTGIAMNAINFNKMVVFCEKLGAIYQPSHPSMELNFIKGLNDENRTKLELNVKAKQHASEVINQRQVVFKPRDRNARRWLKGLKGTRQKQVDIERGAAIIARILGDRLTDLPEETPAPETEGSGKKKGRVNSTSQLGFDRVVDNVGKYVLFLDSLTNYNPNEADMKKSAIQAYWQSIVNANSLVLNANQEEANTRDARNEVMFYRVDSVYSVAQSIKEYLASLENVNSAELKMILKLKFTPLAE